MSLQGPSGRSPLIEASSTSLVLIAPDRSDLALIESEARQHLRRNCSAIASAAESAGVRILVASPVARKGRHGFTKDLRTASIHQEFYSTERRLPWLNPDLVKTLVAENKPILVLAGFWLEFQIVTTALHALAEAYDVYFVVDASPARDPSAAMASHHRLIQAGATPVVTAQVIHEWSAQLSAIRLDRK